MTQVTVDIDRDAQAAYIRLSDEPVHRTIEVSDDIIVDVDKFDVAVGVEILDLAAEIPFGELTKHYHVKSDAIEQLRMVQPSIQGWTSQVQTGSDLAAVAHPVSYLPA